MPNTYCESTSLSYTTNNGVYYYAIDCIYRVGIPFLLSLLTLELEICRSHRECSDTGHCSTRQCPTTERVYRCSPQTQRKLVKAQQWGIYIIIMIDKIHTHVFIPMLIACNVCGSITYYWSGCVFDGNVAIYGCLLLFHRKMCCIYSYMYMLLV